MNCWNPKRFKQRVPKLVKAGEPISFVNLQFIVYIILQNVRQIIQKCVEN